MKKCSSCGATYNDSTNFCSSCGTRLTAVSAQRSRHPGHKKKQHRLVGRLAVPAVVLILVLSTVFIFFYRKEYKPLIVDHNPSVYTYEDLVSDTDLLKSRYSSFFSADSLGETADGRQILHFIIGNEDASRKVLVNGGIHAREYITCQLVMKQTVSFLKHIKNGDSYGDISYKDLLQDTAIHVICMVNPDGVSISQQGLDGIQTDTVRKNLEQISQMDGASLSDNDYLEQWKSNANGVDLNRNFDALWDSYADPAGHPSADHYKGTAPGCEAESNALIQLTLQEHFSRTISYHTQGDVIYWYFGQEGSLYDQTLSFANTIAAATGYPLDADYQALDPAGYKDWAILSQGIPSLTIEVGTGDTPVSPDQFETIWEENQFVWKEMLKTL